MMSLRTVMLSLKIIAVVFWPILGNLAAVDDTYLLNFMMVGVA